VRLAVLAALLLFASAAANAAEERKLSAAEIQAALNGKTAVSIGGSPYRQYFDPSGVTIYLPEGGREDRGKWEADEAKQQYCSWWERGGWSCYDLFETEEGIVWRGESGSEYRARLLDGRQLK
jgi:hypothetical protein